MKKTVAFGEIMLRLSPPGHHRITQTVSLDVTYGGAEANAAVSLANYGAPVSYVSRVPENEIGKAAIQALRLTNVETDSVLFGGDRLGIYFLEMGAGQRSSSVTYDRAHSAMAAIQPGMIDWEKIFKDAGWFHWTGITPAISASAALVCKESIDAARRNGLTVSCDLNYRSSLWKYGKSPVDVMPDLVRDCDVLIADPEAAEKMLGYSAESADMESFLKGLQQKFPNLQSVATTLRSASDAGQLVLTAMLLVQKVVLRGKSYCINQIVDRVGSGDAFTGGLIYGMQQFGSDHQRTLDFALASAVLKHSIPGDFNRVSAEEVFALMNGDHGGKVKR